MMTSFNTFTDALKMANASGLSALDVKEFLAKTAAFYDAPVALADRTDDRVDHLAIVAPSLVSPSLVCPSLVSPSLVSPLLVSPPSSSSAYDLDHVDTLPCIAAAAAFLVLALAVKDDINIPDTIISDDQADDAVLDYIFGDFDVPKAVPEAVPEAVPIDILGTDDEPYELETDALLFVQFPFVLPSQDLFGPPCDTRTPRSVDGVR